MVTEPRVVIAGGGWAGLAAAVELADRGVHVTLIEAASHLGGRARSVPFGALTVDNGQHLLIGAYRETLRLLRRIGVEEERVLSRMPLSLELRDGSGKVRLRTPRLPAPLHLAWALLGAEGLSLAERGAALRFALRMAHRRFAIAEDTTVAALLNDYGQPPRLVAHLWTPLCLATLNLAPENASAQVFLRVLRDAFAQETRDSDLLFPRVHLSRLLPEPAAEFLESKRAEVRLDERVTGLQVEAGRITGVVTEQGTVRARRVVLALPARGAGELLAGIEATQDLGRRLRDLEHTPVTTVYLHYRTPVRLEHPMVGLVGTLTQWVVDRSTCGQRGVMAAVVSGPGEHMAWERTAVAKRVARELSDQFGWPSPEESFVVREKRAAFRCGAGVEAMRPGHETAVAGLWLAGDYTATGYPATLEGAVRSGVECARLILADLGQSHTDPAP